MREFKYTKEEIDKFEKAMTLAINELDSLYQRSGLKEIFIPFNLDRMKKYSENYNSRDWYFVIDDTGFYFSLGLGTKASHFIHFAKRTKFGKNIMQFPINLDDVIFLREYENIKSQVVKEVNEALVQRNSDFAIADKICKNAESIVEINMPGSQNVHEVQVSEENGKKIGVINFGLQTVKIITEGNIVLVNKDDEKDIKKKVR